MHIVTTATFRFVPLHGLFRKNGRMKNCIRSMSCNEEEISMIESYYSTDGIRIRVNGDEVKCIVVNINGKPWEELQFKDVQDYLSDPDSNENCFFEYKIDKVEPAKLVKEISAFANTYGGYIFLGVDDNKNIIGCTAWDEQRIHITIHNGITPTPQFDVKRFSADDKIIYVIKIEEGAMPPYITNKGDICERVSSGSCVVTESGKLNQMYHKRADQLASHKKPN